MLTAGSNSGGGLMATTSFRHTYFVDFEFQISNGERPKIVCMVCTEAETGQTQRFSRRELLKMERAPFETGPDAVMVAYAAQAELGCMLALSWKLPANVIDLYAEFRVETNGRGLKASLLDALAIHGLAHIDASEKEEMRDLILRGGWSQRELELILNYCESDVRALAALYPAMLPKIHLPQALLRGRYAAAVAVMEHHGVPMDGKLLRIVDREWRQIRPALIAEVDPKLELFHGLTFKADQFSRWLRKRDIPWPRLESDYLDLSDDAFKAAANRWPELRPLRELRQCLDQIALSDLRVGSDGRTRSSLWPWAASSGRNQPSTTRFAFGCKVGEGLYLSSRRVRSRLHRFLVAGDRSCCRPVW
jgi:DNA polymerase-1